MSVEYEASSICFGGGHDQRREEQEAKAKEWRRGG